jgi:hypothetical protein
MGDVDGGESSDGLVWEHMLVGRQPGERYSRSRVSPGDLSPLTRDEDNELGHVVMRYPDDDVESDGEEEPGGELPIGVILGAAGLVGAVIAAPRIKRWWVRRRSGSAGAPGADAQEEAQEAGAIAGSPSYSSEVVVVDDASQGHPGPRVVMGASEAQQRLIAAMQARSFSDEQIRLLRTVEIADDSLLAAGHQALPTSSPAGVGRGPLELEAPRLSADELLLSRLGHGDSRERVGDGHAITVQAVASTVETPADPEVAHPRPAPVAGPGTGVSAPPLPDPGWYRDPWSIGDLRYWDGHRWTHHVG